MSVFESQSLASGREPRLKKMTKRAQQMLEEQQQRNPREQKVKAAASVASQPKLINDEGDGFMYGPAESYAPPTLTGADDLDLMRSTEAEAKHILKLWAHRGDGDWQVQYQERQINLDDLRQARNNPGADILKPKVQGLSSAANKGKGRAIDDDLDDDALGSHQTIYTGITIGRSPADSSHGQDTHAGHALRLEYPPSEPFPLAKRPAPSQSEQPIAKKPRVEHEGDRNLDTDDAPAKARKPARAPSQPTVQAPRPSVVTPKEPSAKPSYGGPRPSTNLQLVSCGGSTPRRTTPGVANLQPNKPPIKPLVQERPRPDPPGLDRLEPSPHKAHRPRFAQSNNDRLYSVPPQPQSFAYQPPTKKAHPASTSNGNAVSRVPVSKNATTMYADRVNGQTHKQAGLATTVSKRPDVYAAPVVRLVTRKRTSATVKWRNAHHDQPKVPLDLPAVPTGHAGGRPDPVKPKPKRASDVTEKRDVAHEPAGEPLARKDRAGARPEPIPKPKHAPDAAKKRAVPRQPVEEPPAVPQVRKDHAGARPEPIPKSKRAPNAAEKHGVPCQLVEEPLAAPAVRKAGAGVHPDPTLKPKHAPDVAKKRTVPRGQAAESPAERRVAKNRAAARPDPIRKRASEAAKRQGAAHRGIEAPPAEPRMPNRPARNEQPPAHYPRGRATPEDNDDDQEDDDTAVEEDDDDNFGATHIYRFVSSNTPTVNSYPPEVQPVVKLMAIRSKPWIVSCGTFDWREGDPGEEVPTSDTIVARCFALACRELQKRYLFRDDHVKTVSILITTYRHHTKAVIMALIEKDGEFEDNQPGYNGKLSAWLLPDAFHEGEPESKADRHPFESGLVSKAIARTLFGTNNYGLKFAERFNPIPLRFLAFICCIMNHVIYCYRDGYFNRKDRLVSTQQELAFRQYLALLDEMHQNRPYALRELCGTLYDQARLEASRVEMRAEAPRPPRKWAPDIHEEYISQYREPTPRPDDETDGEIPLPRDTQLEDEDQAERRKASRRHSQANARASRRSPPPKKPEAHKSKYVPPPSLSDEETDDRGEGPSRPYGIRPVDEDDDDEDRGEGPSRPYGAHPLNEEDADDDLPSPRRVFLRSVSEPSDPELEPSGPEEEEED